MSPPDSLFDRFCDPEYVAGDVIRVLICDDDPLVLRAIANLMVSDATLEVVGLAATPAEGLSLAVETQPDVAIVDVNMPGGGGAQLARDLKEHSPNTRVIALSGSGGHDIVLTMFEAGAISFLIKGDSPSAILAAVHTARSGHSTLSESLTHDLIDDLVNAREKSRRATEALQRRREAVENLFSDKEAVQIAVQPIRQLSDRRIVGHEALARFHTSPQRGPDRWFKAARQVGMLQRLELLAVRRALARINEAPDSTYLSINASPSTVTSAEFMRLLVCAPAARVVVEITEHAEIGNYRRFRDRFDQLRQLGVRLAVDDAGAGYASLRHILELRPEIIKLDITLISGIHRNHGQQALARGLISFAEGTGATIVAEGIETPEELAMLQDLGVTLGQGYYLGRPSPTYRVDDSPL